MGQHGTRCRCHVRLIGTDSLVKSHIYIYIYVEVTMAICVSNILLDDDEVRVELLDDDIGYWLDHYLSFEGSFIAMSCFLVLARTSLLGELSRSWKHQSCFAGLDATASKALALPSLA